MRFVEVKFLSSRDESAARGYLYRDDLPRALKKYDAVLVPTRYGLSLAVVNKTFADEETAQNESQWRHDTAAIKGVKEKIKSKTIEEVQSKEKIKDLKKKLERKIKKVDEVEKYRMYADIDPEIAEMLAQLEELKSE